MQNVSFQPFYFIPSLQFWLQPALKQLSMMLLCLAVQLFLLIPVCVSFGSDFYTEISADQLDYVAIEVPRHTSYLEVQLWAESSQMNPTVLLRYDGLPTLDLYDAKLSIPSPPSVLQILDLQPTQSVLYLSLFGGSKLHRFRYFAGEATSKLVGVQSEIRSCASEYQSSPNCTQSVSLSATSEADGAPTPLLLTTNATLAAVITVPQRTERILMGITIDDPAALCVELGPSNNRSFTFVFDLYIDQPLEENNAGRRVVTLNYSTLCLSSLLSSRRIATLVVERPVPGVWTLRSTLQIVNQLDSGTSYQRKSASNNVDLESYDAVLGGNKLNIRVVDRVVLRFDHRPRSVGQQSQLLSQAPLKVPLTITTTLSTCPAGKTASLTSPRDTILGQAQDTYGERQDPPGELQCTSSVVAMDAVRTPLIARGVYALHGRTALLSAINSSLPKLKDGVHGGASGGESGEVIGAHNPFVVYEAVVPAQVQRLAVGGGMILQLSVSLPVTGDELHSDQFVRLMDNLHFQVAARFAGLPGDPNVYQYDTVRGYNFDVQSPNAFILSTRSATITDKLMSSASGDDDDGSSLQRNEAFPMSVRRWLQNWLHDTAGSAPPIQAQVRQRTHTARTNTRTYTWVITRPALPGLTVSSLDGAGSRLFLRIAREPFAPPSEKPTEDQILSAPRPFGIMHGSSHHQAHHAHNKHRHRSVREDNAGAARDTVTLNTAAAAEALNIATSLVFEPCPKGSCVHGQCYTQEGDINAYTCSCRYPWAGESCDSLSVPYPFYVIQVLILTLSNMVMLPAVLQSLICELPFVATLLGSSAVASSVYHLCDIDVYCLGGLSFHSLQVMDILFSICSIASILLLFAPVSRPVHTALSLLCLAMLVPPVADAPTSPVNLMVALSFALIVLAIGWGIVLCQGDRWGGAVTPLLGGLFLRMQRDPLLHGTVEAVQDLDKPLTVMINNEEMVYSSIARNSPDLREEDIEMISFSQDRAAAGNEMPLGSSDSAAVFGEIEEAICFKKCTEGGRRVWVLPAAGLSVGLVGLLCFALQRRENYYMLHSLWHVFIMVAAYLLVRGRHQWYDTIATE